MAFATTGEYTAYFSLSTDSVSVKRSKTLASINTIVNRLNQIFETELSVRIQLIPNNDSLIYTNASTDPYSNNNLDADLLVNHNNINTVIGAANYDWGHLLGTAYPGGKAYLRSVCDPSYKGGGATGDDIPTGEIFIVELLAHEMGHMMGANHTQYNNCNRKQSTSVETGSGSTIMSYAGVCAPNVINASDPYYHAISLDEMITYMHTGAGDGCAVKTNTGNTAPSLNTALNDFIIPKTTPFFLQLNASDAENNSLTYCWEQMDVLPVGATAQTMPPNAANTNGPMFRSNLPSASPTRYFPNTSSVLNGTNNNTWEVLPSVNRDLNFRGTVRDNASVGGCRIDDNVLVKVVNTAGPFVINYPNSAVSWKTTYKQKIRWDVANTNKLPINCTAVNILFSNDGGISYSTLASNVPNTGVASIDVPMQTGTQSRIKIEGVGNIFYDISNTNFTIASVSSADYQLWVDQESKRVCGQSSATFPIDIRSIAGFSGNVNLTVSNLPVGVTGDFSTSIVSAGASSTLTLNNVNTLSVGTYSFTVNSISGNNSQTVTLSLEILPSTMNIIPVSPSNLAAGVSWITPKIVWNSHSSAEQYDFQFSDDQNFTNIILEQLNIFDTTYSFTSNLTSSKSYWWRVRAKNTCLTDNYATFKFTTTIPAQTYTFTSTNVPITIPTNKSGSFNSTLNIAANGRIFDVDVVNLDITHTYLQDITIKLAHPDNTQIIIFDANKCGNKDNVKIGFDDESSNSNTSIPCPPTTNLSYVPDQSLTAFDNKSITGTWTLTVADSYAASDGGSINAWGLKITLLPTFIWQGSVSNVWTNASNWAPAGVPPVGSDVEIPKNVVNFPSLDQDISIANLNIKDSALVDLNGKTLNLTGAITGTGKIKGSTASSINITGNSGVLYFDQSQNGLTNVLKNLTITGKSTTYLGNALSLIGGSNSGTLLLSLDAILNTGGNLILLSDSLGTAKVGSSQGIIQGNVEVQRFISAKESRKWVYVAAPIVQPNNSYIKDAWQNQIFITGNGLGGTICGTTNGNGLINTDKFNSNGFDVTASLTPSMFKYSSTLVNNSNWVSINNTNASKLEYGIGYRLNVRGSRGDLDTNCSVQLNNAFPPSPTSVVLKSIGELKMGNVSINLTGTNSHPYTLIGNPYASPIDFTTFRAANADKIEDKFWAYSPKLDANTYTHYNAGSYTNAAFGWDVNSISTISSGQAFFVENKLNQNSVLFSESHKSNATIPNSNYFKNTINWDNIIRVGLKNKTNYLLDETLVRFSDLINNNSSINNFDGISFNSGTFIATQKNNSVLAIQTRIKVVDIDSIDLHVQFSKLDNYTLQFNEFDLLAKSNNIYLIDKCINKKIRIDRDSIYSFSINENLESQKSNRFQLVIKNTTNKSLKFTGINAQKINSFNKIEWKVNEEDKLYRYSVEKSVDGVNYNSIASIFPDESINYSFIDTSINMNATWYRIKTTGDDSYIPKLSMAVKVEQNDDLSNNLILFPNPIESNIFLQKFGKKENTFELSIYDLMGNILYRKNNIQFYLEPIKFDIGFLQSGVYIIEIKDAKFNKKSFRILKK